MIRSSLPFALLFVLGCTANLPGNAGEDPTDDPGIDDPGNPGPGFCDDAANDNGGLDELTCFDVLENPAADPIATIEHAFEVIDGVDAVHVRLTFDPSFVDNTFGANALGWDAAKNGHTFTDLVKSDHAQLQLVDGDGAITFDLKLDYISEDSSARCGFSSLGVAGGDGAVMLGDPSAVLAWSSSLDRNLNELGLCEYTTDSPETASACEPSAEAPEWNFQVVYDVWVAASAFGLAGFGRGHIDFVHASPAKEGENTVTVIPGDCPDDWCAENGDGCPDPHDFPDVE